MLFGLRFERRDVRLLRSLADAVRKGERGLGEQAANVFEQAALAAESGEPLELHCTDPMEAVEMAVAYVRYGVTRPVIEELSGT
jgi:hypothetical protein